MRLCSRGWSRTARLLPCPTVMDSQSQSGAHPVRAGRFFSFTARMIRRRAPRRHSDPHRSGACLRTGHHETTALCLKALSLSARRGRHAFGARSRLRQRRAGDRAAKLLARSSHRNRHRSDRGRGRHGIAVSNGVGPLVRASSPIGLEHPAIRASAPYELILANILASPFIEIAPALFQTGAWSERSSFRPAAEPGKSRAERLPRSRLVFRRALRDGPWSALVLIDPEA